MIEQDYILKILQEFFEAIAKVVRRSDEDDEAATADMQARYNAIYEQFFRCPAHHFYEIEKEDLLNDLWTENSEQKALAKMRMLSELLYRDALIKKEGSLRLRLVGESIASARIFATEQQNLFVGSGEQNGLYSYSA